MDNRKILNLLCTFLFTHSSRTWKTKVRTEEVRMKSKLSPILRCGSVILVMVLVTESTNYKSITVTSSVWQVSHKIEARNSMICSINCHLLDRTDQVCNSFSYDPVTQQCSMASLLDLYRDDMGQSGGEEVWVKDGIPVLGKNIVFKNI